MARFVWILSGFVLCGGVLQTVAKTQDAGIDGQPPQKEAIASLRARGPEGLEQALNIYDGLQKDREQLQHQMGQVSAAGAKGNKETIATIEKQIAGIDGRMKAWQAAIEQIGSQRSCTVSRLY